MAELLAGLLALIVLSAYPASLYAWYRVWTHRRSDVESGGQLVPVVPRRFPFWTLADVLVLVGLYMIFGGILGGVAQRAGWVERPAVRAEVKEDADRPAEQGRADREATGFDEPQREREDAAEPGVPAADKVGPAADEDAPAADEDGPATDEDGPAADEDGPAADEAGLAADEVGLAADEAGLATDKDGPAADEDGPAADKDGPAADEDGPAADEDGPTADKDGPAADEAGPVAGEETEAAGDGTTPGRGLTVVEIMLHSVATLLATLSMIGLLAWRSAAPWRDLGLRPRLAFIRLGAWAALLILPPVTILMRLMTLVIEYEHPVLDQLQAAPSAASVVALFVSTVLIAPLTEEFGFRVLLQGSLQRLADGAPDDASNWRPRALWPIVVTSGLFAGMHWGQGPAPVPLFFLACGLGYLYRQTGSMMPPLVIHMILNGITVIVTIVMMLSGVGDGVGIDP